MPGSSRGGESRRWAAGRRRGIDGPGIATSRANFPPRAGSPVAFHAIAQAPTTLRLVAPACPPGPTAAPRGSRHQCGSGDRVAAGRGHTRRSHRVPSPRLQPFAARGKRPTGPLRITKDTPSFRQGDRKRPNDGTNAAKLDQLGQLLLSMFDGSELGKCNLSVPELELETERHQALGIRFSKPRQCLSSPQGPWNVTQLLAALQRDGKSIDSASIEQSPRRDPVGPTINRSGLLCQSHRQIGVGHRTRGAVLPGVLGSSEARAA